MPALLTRIALRVLVSCLLLVAVAGVSWPQQRAEPAGSTLLTIDFRAFTRDGVPIRDLRPEEVTLKVGRRPRDVVAMQLVQVPASVDARTAAASSAPAPYVTNALSGAGGRDVVIVTDDEGIQSSGAKRVADVLTAMVGQFSPADRIAWIIPGNEGERVQLTTRHDVVRAAISRLAGHATPNEAEADTLCRTRRNLFALKAVFENIAPSIPSVVVFVSNGFSPPTAVESVSRRAQGPEGPCEILPHDLEDLTNAAVASRAHVFGIEVIDDTRSGAARTGDLSGGFEHIAGMSGNTVIRLTGSELAAVKRIASETSAYYVAAFEVTPEEQDGSSQKVEVAVSRPDTTVRTWPTVKMPKREARDAKASSVKLRDVLSVSKMFRDLPLRASVHTSRATPDGRPKVVCVFEPAEPDTPLAEAAIAVFDDKGTSRAGWSGQKDALKELPVIASLNTPQPGTYRLRLAAKDGSGAVGTIDYDVKIEPAGKGTVALGALVLGKAGKQGFSPLLQFTTEPTAIGAVEIYGAPKTAKIAAVFELAASETSPALATLAGNVQSIRDDVQIASMAFPVQQMPPGDVVVRALVSVDGTALAVKPTRTLRKVAK